MRTYSKRQRAARRKSIVSPTVILASVAAVAREVAHAAAIQRGAGWLAAEQKMHRVGQVPGQICYGLSVKTPGQDAKSPGARYYRPTQLCF